MFRICAYGSIGLLLIVLALSQSKWSGLNDRISHALGWGAAGLLIMGMVGVFVLIFRHRVDKAWQNASFDLTDGQITQVMEGRAPIALSLTGINLLGDSRLGLIVRSGEPARGFFIPRAVDGFDQLKIQLNVYCKVSVIEDKTSFIPVLPLVLTVGLYAVLFAAKTALVVLVVGAVALLFQGWSILSMRTILSKTRSQTIDVGLHILLADSSVACLPEVFVGSQLLINRITGHLVLGPNSACPVNRVISNDAGRFKRFYSWVFCARTHLCHDTRIAGL